METMILITHILRALSGAAILGLSVMAGTILVRRYSARVVGLITALISH